MNRSPGAVAMIAQSLLNCSACWQTAPMQFLVGDIGATHARLALSDSEGGLQQVEHYPTQDFPTFAPLLQRYQEDTNCRGLNGCCLAMAGPVQQGQGKITNGELVINERELATLLGTGRVALVNDFVALASGVAYLPTSSLESLGGDSPKIATRALLGPGSGLGMAVLLPEGSGWRVLPSEGGHADYAPGNALEQEILTLLQGRFGHVCWEQLLSGPGLLNLYQVVCTIWGSEPVAQSPVEVSRLGESDEDPVCHQTLEVFCAGLGAAAGNLALTVCAEGGVYLGGGITPKIIEFLKTSDFRNRFEDRGDLAPYIKPISTQVILDPLAGLRGAAVYYLQEEHNGA